MISFPEYFIGTVCSLRKLIFFHIYKKNIVYVAPPTAWNSQAGSVATKFVGPQSTELSSVGSSTAVLDKFQFKFKAALMSWKTYTIVILGWVSSHDSMNNVIVSFIETQNICCRWQWTKQNTDNNLSVWLVYDLTALSTQYTNYVIMHLWER